MTFFVKKIIATINNVTGDSNFTTYREKWEFLKYKVRQISISSGKLLSRISRKKEFEIIKEINSICIRPSLNEIYKQKLLLLQSSLDKIYIDKAKGV